MSLPIVAPRQTAADISQHDFVIGGWSCGMKVSASHGVSLDQANPAHFGGIYDTYILTPTAAGLSLTMAAISTATSTSLAPGYSCWVRNASAIYSLRVLDSASAEIMTLPPGTSVRLDTAGSAWTKTTAQAEYTLVTTDATPTQIFEVVVPTGKAFSLTARVLSLTGTAPVSFTYAITGMNNGGTVAVSFDRLASSDALTTRDVGYSISGASIRVRVTGVAATTINWKATYDLLLL